MPVPAPFSEPVILKSPTAVQPDDGTDARAFVAVE